MEFEVETVLGARQEVEASEGDFEGVVRDPKVGERVAHHKLDCRRFRDGNVKVGITSLFMSELCCERGISIRAMSNGNEGSAHSNQPSVQGL